MTPCSNRLSRRWSAREWIDSVGITNQEDALRQASGEAFYNTSRFSLSDLTSPGREQQLRDDFLAYLDGFSPNVQEVLENFEFRNQIPRLVSTGALVFLLDKFLDRSINLSFYPVLSADGSVRIEGLDSHGMGTVFKELIRRFNEENNEEAGEHFTPRDVVQLMARLVFLPVADSVSSSTYLVYDGACGTGGMLTVAEETLAQLASDQGKGVSIDLYGQEVNPETYAISKADLIPEGEGVKADNISYGSTLSDAAFPLRTFDFMLSNPPYGKIWKTDLAHMGVKSDITDPRFIVDHDGDLEYSLITRSSDGQMMFLANMLSKMKTRSEQTSMGSRIAEVYNGSSLFTGDAGQGESNIRRRIIENDWLEAIVALPLNMFYNTGIATYVWVLSDSKALHCKGKVQLIDATQWYRPLHKNLGNKNCELADEDSQSICDAFPGFEETEQSKIFPNETFGYSKVTVEHPLRLTTELSQERRENFRDTCRKAKEEPLANLVDRVEAEIGPGPHRDFNRFMSVVVAGATAHGVKLTAKRKTLLRTSLAFRDETAEPVIKTTHHAGTAEPDALRGFYSVTIACRPVVVEYESDTDLQDTEQVPLLHEGGIEAFLRREVLPYGSDAWYNSDSVKVGYEISFSHHFYKPQPLRPLEEIRSDILALERETEGLLVDIVGGVQV